MDTTGSPHIAIRLATGADTAALARIAALDSAPSPRGALLVARIDGELVAAHPLAGGRGRPIADPFRPTADARELLALRAAQLPRKSQSRRRYLPGFLTRRRDVGSPAAA
jgi:hypothetical protein